MYKNPIYFYDFKFKLVNQNMNLNLLGKLTFESFRLWIKNIENKKKLKIEKIS